MCREVCGASLKAAPKSKLLRLSFGVMNGLAPISGSDGKPVMQGVSQASNITLAEQPRRPAAALRPVPQAAALARPAVVEKVVHPVRLALRLRLA